MNEWYKKEEIILKQRAHDQWVHEGDENSSLFHLIASHRKWNNHNSFLNDGHSNILYNDQTLVIILWIISLVFLLLLGF